MSVEEKYMQRCLQLAEKGRGYVSPNPMVGAVVVHEGKIIGEGYHRQYGKAHAEVNAILDVKDTSLLKNSTIYVSLEPCSHYGKTPPCAQLIIDSEIPKVVIATLDPNPQVAGKGLKMLQDAGIETVVSVLEEEAQALNKAFFTSKIHHRPYVYLKWAQSKDGFIDKTRLSTEDSRPTPISNSFTKMLVHKMRSEISAIMIGTNTALSDNSSLTTRHWFGKNPIRVVLDRQLRIPSDYYIYNDKVKTIIFSEEAGENLDKEKTQIIQLNFDDNLLPNILAKLCELKIDSLMVEGGRQLLQSFIDQNLWNEAYVEISSKTFTDGVQAPSITGKIMEKTFVNDSKRIHFINKN